MSQQAMIPNADAKTTEECVQKYADADGCPGGLPKGSDNSEVHGEQEANFDGFELVADGSDRSGRQRHTDLSHEVTSNAGPGVWPKLAVIQGIRLYPFDFRHQ